MFLIKVSSRPPVQIDFVGKKSLLKLKDKKQSKNFAIFSLKENKPGEPLLLHDEPIYLKDKIIGRTTSGNYSFNYNKNISFGYINSNYSKEDLLNNELFIEVEKKKYPATIFLKPLNSQNKNDKK